jgi:hypothetical protein
MELWYSDFNSDTLATVAHSTRTTVHHERSSRRTYYRRELKQALLIGNTVRYCYMLQIHQHKHRTARLRPSEKIEYGSFHKTSMLTLEDGHRGRNMQLDLLNNVLRKMLALL